MCILKLCCTLTVLYVPYCVFCIIVLFCAFLFCVCTVLLPPGENPIAGNIIYLSIYKYGRGPLNRTWEADGWTRLTYIVTRSVCYSRYAIRTRILQYICLTLCFGDLQDKHIHVVANDIAHAKHLYDWRDVILTTQNSTYATHVKNKRVNIQHAE
jgi:hypothetical protein